VCVSGIPGEYTSVAGYLNYDRYEYFLLDVMTPVPDSDTAETGSSQMNSTLAPHCCNHWAKILNAVSLLRSLATWLFVAWNPFALVFRSLLFFWVYL